MFMLLVGLGQSKIIKITLDFTFSTEVSSHNFTFSITLRDLVLIEILSFNLYSMNFPYLANVELWSYFSNNSPLERSTTDLPQIVIPSMFHYEHIIFDQLPLLFTGAYHLSDSSTTDFLRLTTLFDTKGFYPHS